ncbi:hypothetical protein PV08_08037 [Exophiala spinifera]|uniref:Major facilitator superfamily (MFS) profile domain-containing protein n=1 Tax=Exophiala spinifera TaxID=91928 RepID=A0A0D2B2L2_9EURO|nr:uncharacterized protein PV08_08037 [Exophiala spinifera]KIW12850.1 hypothetical protein PV08_08037 [Exophiala spinifera]
MSNIKIRDAVDEEGGSDSSYNLGAEDHKPQKAISAQNWSTGTKLYHTTIPCSLAFLITFSSSVTSPATSTLMTEFNVNRTQALLPGTVYMVGLAFGPLIMAPLSEFVGRRWLYIVTSSSIVAFAAGSGAAQTFATLLSCRFLCGLLGSAGIAIGAGTILDLWGIAEAGGLARLLFILGPFLGPTMGPLVGAYVMHDHHGDWRWTQWVVALIGAPIWILVLFMKETSGARIQHRAKHPGRFGIVGLALSTLKESTLRSTRILTTEAIAISLTLYTGYGYAVVFSFFASAAYVFTLDYDFNSRQVGLSLMSVVIGYFVAAVVHIIVQKTLYARAIQQAPNGIPAPEHRLYTAMAGSIFLPIGLFWYSWEAHRGGHWAAVVASGIPFGFGTFVIFLSSISYLIESYGAGAAASAVAANGTFRYLLGAVFPLFTIQMYEKLHVHWAGSVFAFLSLALLPIPWILFRYGHILRKKSRFIASA